MNDMHNELIDDFIAAYNVMESNCIIYWCDRTCANFENKIYYSSLNSALGTTVDAGVSPSECLWMFPLWDCFEEVST